MDTKLYKKLAALIKFEFDFNNDAELAFITRIDKVVARRGGRMEFIRRPKYRLSANEVEAMVTGVQKDIQRIINQYNKYSEFDGVKFELVSAGRAPRTGIYKLGIQFNVELKLRVVKQVFNTGLVIAAGYEQLECNDEGLTDFDDALRIACEQERMEAPGIVERADARRLFKAEFKRN